MGLGFSFQCFLRDYVGTSHDLELRWLSSIANVPDTLEDNLNDA